MRVTSKGQVTIPIEIRAKLGLLPHTEVVFAIEGDKAIIRKADVPEGGRGGFLVRQMRGRATVSMTTDEIMALTRASE
jgi:AbrB family looped-hinge helix DNA binding protein